ncbi:MAG: holo-ACP synthase [Chloroflexi bacterium]|nr:holo-ACP synthase [Chloroflexota bacterium]
MLRTGVDVVEIERFAGMLQRHGERVLRRLFTPQERAQCQGKAESLAARFAAKEAAAKALGTGIGTVRWVDLEILTDAHGAPHLYLHEAAARQAAWLGLTEWSVSLSHTKNCAVAVVVAQGKP